MAFEVNKIVIKYKLLRFVKKIIFDEGEHECTSHSQQCFVIETHFGRALSISVGTH